MKFDSHVKLTTAALRLLRARCPVDAATCNAPLFHATPTVWAHDAKKSTFVDNWGRAVTSTILSALFSPQLGDGVALVDVQQRWTHDHPDGQKFHFMRAPGETNFQAYMKAKGFIHFHTQQWTKLANGLLKEKRDPLGQATRRETQAFQVDLSLALHCLQDSFSTGHTKRGFDEGVPVNIRDAGTLAGAAPIRELYVYAEQDHNKHADEDYTSGGVESGMGRLAVEATAALIAMGITSIPSTKGLVGWDAFVSKWLREQIGAGGENAVLRP